VYLNTGASKTAGSAGSVINIQYDRDIWSFDNF
jgi:hypothetical protein